MKIVLLPGLDGTGTLFQPLVQLLPQSDCLTLPLPDTGDQSYLCQHQYLLDRLPREDFILLAESFSGPTAALLAANPPTALKGIIFVATFLTPPNPLLVKAAMTISVPRLLNLPGAKQFLKFRFLRGSEGGVGAPLLHKTLKGLSPKLIHDRLSALTKLPSLEFQSHLPALYIQATKDTIVPKSREMDFRRHFTDLTVRKVETTHLVLQTKPRQCAQLVTEFIRRVTGSMKENG